MTSSVIVIQTQKKFLGKIRITVMPIPTEKRTNPHKRFMVFPF